MLKTTYELEGDRLEILLVYRRVEALRAFGRSLLHGANRGTLPNVDAVIRRATTPTVGLKLQKEFPEHGLFTGFITAIDKDDSAEWVFTISYEDGDSETMVLEELEPLLSTHGNALREYAVRELMLGYTYLENRLTGMCDSSFDCTHTYLVCELMQLFDPSYVAEHATTIDSLWVQRLVAVVPIARADGGKLVAALEGELAAYLSKAKGFTSDHSNVDEFTTAVLGWWKGNAKELPRNDG
ncbi:hypothetical protein CYMTET_17607, partial [Cymbomonas tetramitiformis]